MRPSIRNRFTLGIERCEEIISICSLRKSLGRSCKDCTELDECFKFIEIYTRPPFISQLDYIEAYNKQKRKELKNMALSDHNKSRNTKWNVSTEGLPYVKLSELAENTDYPLYGCFITKDNGYGEGCCLITDGCIVNIPQSKIGIVKDILSDQEAVEEILAGSATFCYSKFISEKFHRPAYNIEFK